MTSAPLSFQANLSEPARSLSEFRTYLRRTVTVPTYHGYHRPGLGSVGCIYSEKPRGPGGSDITECRQLISKYPARRRHHIAEGSRHTLIQADMYPALYALMPIPKKGTRELVDPRRIDFEVGQPVLTSQHVSGRPPEFTRNAAGAGPTVLNLPFDIPRDIFKGAM
jgi:hypothetical protein